MEWYEILNTTIQIGKGFVLNWVGNALSMLTRSTGGVIQGVEALEFVDSEIELEEIIDDSAAYFLDTTPKTIDCNTKND